MPVLPLYLCRDYRRVELDFVVKTIRDAVGAYGIKFVVFDNLHFLGRKAKNVSQEVAVATQEFKLLAEDLHIPIMLVVQPRKSDPDEIIGIEDLRDSSLIGADVDHVIMMHRKRIRSNTEEYKQLDSALAPETFFRLDASRYYPGGDTALYFEGSISKLGA